LRRNFKLSAKLSLFHRLHHDCRDHVISSIQNEPGQPGDSSGRVYRRRRVHQHSLLHRDGVLQQNGQRNVGAVRRSRTVLSAFADLDYNRAKEQVHEKRIEVRLGSHSVRPSDQWVSSQNNFT